MTPTESTTALAYLPATFDMPTDSSDESFEHVVKTLNRFHGDSLAGKIDPDGKLHHQHVASYSGEVIDHDTDYSALRNRVLAIPGIEPSPIVMD